MKLTDRWYDILKWFAQYFLPAVATLYTSLGSLWNLPYIFEIVGTISAVDTFIGFVLGLSSYNYDGDGTLHIDTTDSEKDIYKMSLNIPIEELGDKKSVTFNVDKNESSK